RGFHAVIIALWNGIELMIVTTCAIDREAQERLADRSDHVLEFVFSYTLLQQCAGRRVTGFVPRAVNKKSCGYDAFAPWRAQNITGQLLAHKLIVWLVGIETLNHV